MENAERSTRAVRGQLEEGSRSPAKYDGRSSSQHVLADASGGQADEWAAALCCDPRRRAQSHGSPSRTVDGLSAAQSRESARNLRSISGRRQKLIAIKT